MTPPHTEGLEKQVEQIAKNLLRRSPLRRGPFLISDEELKSALKSRAAIGEKA